MTWHFSRMFTALVLLLGGCGGSPASETDAGTGDAAIDAAVEDDASVTDDGGAPDAFVRTDGGGPASDRLAIVSTYLGGVSSYRVGAEAQLSLVDGAPYDDGAHFYGLAVHPSSRFAYAWDLDAGTVVAYAVDASGTLTHVAGSPFDVGSMPTSGAVDSSGRFLYLGYVETAGVGVFAIDEDTGALTEIAGSPFDLAGPAAYLAIDPDEGFLFASLSSGGIAVHQLSEAGEVGPAVAGSPFDAASIFGGALVVAPSGDHVYGGRSSLRGYSVSASGALVAIDGSPFSSDVSADPSAISLAVDPSGRFAYALNMSNGHVNGLTVGEDGALTAFAGAPATASVPYSIAIDPDGSFAYVAGDVGSIATFRIDATTGALTAVGEPTPIAGLQPQIVIVNAP